MPYLASRNQASRASRAGSSVRCCAEAAARRRGGARRETCSLSRDRAVRSHEGPHRPDDAPVRAGVVTGAGAAYSNTYSPDPIATTTTSPLLYGGRDALGGRHRSSALGDGGELAQMEANRGARVGRHAHRDAHATARDRPARRRGAVRRQQLGARRGEPAAGLRGDEQVLVRRRGLVEIEAGHDAHHPVADGAVRVVVERVHADVLEALSGFCPSHRSQIVVAPCVIGYSHEG